MLRLKVFLVAVLACSVLALPRQTKIHEDTGLSVLELIPKYGYPLERHTITTEDGYILETHRIPHGKNNADQTNKPVVFVQHGVLSSSADWVNMGPEKGLGYLLADAGYDVWIGNSRGNTWSRKHTSLDPDGLVDQAYFWSFSWQEMGVYDIPANIDYILAQTGAPNLFYIGHSQGTTVFYVMASEKPEYNDKIRLAVLMGPAAFMENLENPFLQLLALYEYNTAWLATWIGLYEMSPHDDLGSLMTAWYCQDMAIAQEMCANSIFMIAGYDSEQLNSTMLPVIMTSTPAGAATKQALHYTQEINSGHFRKYDYGLLNYDHYGQATPPDYDLTKITAPVALFYSSNDWLVNIVDVERAVAQLPNVATKHLVAFEKFNHLDFLWAIDVVPLVYSHVLDLMTNY